MMKLGELIDELTEIMENEGPQCEVLLAIQPRWPFEHSISRTVFADGKVYIAEGRQINYLSEAAHDALEWGE